MPNNNNHLIPPFLGYSPLRRLWLLWWSYVFLIVPIVIVEGQITCSRCTQKTSRRTFPAWLCALDTGFGYETPCGPHGPCECTYFSSNPGPRVDETRFPYQCELLFQSDAVENDSCYCAVEYDPVCAAEKCEYAYQCGDTLFVCWNVIDPRYLQLEDLSSGSSFFTDLQRIIHCDDFKHNSIQGDQVDGDPYCGGCVWGENLMPEEIVGTAICPNREEVTRYIQFCTPPASVTTGVLTGTCQVEAAECDFGFCDYGDASFTITEYDETSRTISEPPAVASESPTCSKGYVRSIVPTNAPIRPTNAPVSLRKKKKKKERVKKPKTKKLKKPGKVKDNAFA
jgi:hypothetical protein